MSAASGLTLEALTARVAELEVTVKTLTHKLAHQSIHPLSDMMLEMPMKTFLASLSLVALGAIFLTFFSGVFVGPAVFKWLGRDPITVTRFLTAGIVLILFLILFDAQHWHKRKICCNTGNFWTMMFSIVAVNTFIVGALLAIERYPSYPIAIAIAAFPVLAIFLKKCLLKEMGGGMAGNKATTVMVGGDNGCMEDSATASSTSRERNVSVDAMAMKKANKLGNATDPEALEQMADEIHQSYQKIAAYALITRTFLFLAVMTMIVWIAWLAAYDIWAFDAEARELLGGNPNTNCSATHEVRLHAEGRPMSHLITPSSPRPTRLEVLTRTRTLHLHLHAGRRSPSGGQGRRLFDLQGHLPPVVITAHPILRLDCQRNRLRTPGRPGEI